MNNNISLYIHIYRYFLHILSQTPLLFLSYFESHELAAFINFNYQLVNSVNNETIQHIINEIYILLGKYYIQLEISQSESISVYHSYFTYLSNNLSDFNILKHIDNIIYNILITYTIRSKNENDNNYTLSLDKSITFFFNNISKLVSSTKIDRNNSKSNELYFIIMNWFYLYQFIIKSENTKIEYENENEDNNGIDISQVLPDDINDVVYSYIQSNCILYISHFYCLLDSNILSVKLLHTHCLTFRLLYESLDEEKYMNLFKLLFESYKSSKFIDKIEAKDESEEVRLLTDCFYYFITKSTPNLFRRLLNEFLNILISKPYIDKIIILYFVHIIHITVKDSTKKSQVLVKCYGILIKLIDIFFSLIEILVYFLIYFFQ